jgi:hypothetical protein
VGVARAVDLSVRLTDRERNGAISEKDNFAKDVEIITDP